MTRRWLAGLGLALCFGFVGCEKPADNSTVLDSSAANPMSSEGKSMEMPAPSTGGEEAPAAEAPATEAPAEETPAAEAPAAEAPAETPAGDGSGN